MVSIFTNQGLTFADILILLWGRKMQILNCVDAVTLGWNHLLTSLILALWAPPRPPWPWAKAWGFSWAVCPQRAHLCSGPWGLKGREEGWERWHLHSLDNEAHTVRCVLPEAQPPCKAEHQPPALTAPCYCCHQGGQGPPGGPDLPLLWVPPRARTRAAWTQGTVPAEPTEVRPTQRATASDPSRKQFKHCSFWQVTGSKKMPSSSEVSREGPAEPQSLVSVPPSVWSVKKKN